MAKVLPSWRQMLLTGTVFLLLVPAVAGLGMWEQPVYSHGSGTEPYSPWDPLAAQLARASEAGLSVLRWPLGTLAIEDALRRNVSDSWHAALVAPALIANALLWALVACLVWNAAMSLLQPRDA